MSQPQFKMNTNTEQIEVSWDDHSVQFDATESTGTNQTLTIHTLQRMLMIQGNTIHVRWNRAPSRTLLHLVYDTLATVPNVTVNPSKAEALDAYAAPITGESEATVVPQSDSVINNAHVNPPQRSMADLIWKIQSFDELVSLTPNDVMINHVWALRTMLRFPKAHYDTEHASIAEELIQRVSHLEPKAFVRSYALGDQSPVPLLMWFRSNEETVLTMLQEYMHLCHPCCRVWHWQLVPTDVTISSVQKGFAAAHIFPSFNGLFSALIPSPAKPPSFVSVEIAANRLVGDPLRLLVYTLYDNGSGVMWLDDDMFFFVMEEDNDIDNHHHLPPARAPLNASELPRWVAQLLKDAMPTGHLVDDSINVFLNLFLGSDPTASMQLLRHINWAMLPLYWTPTFVKDTPIQVRESDSHSAQRKLIDVMGQNETAETKCDALSILQSFTGVSRKRPLPTTPSPEP